MTDSRIRQAVFYRGSVQGVGFRYSTQSIAGQFAVTGYVKNLADGRVEVVAEGDAAEIERFKQAIDERMGHYIHGSECREEAYRGEFPGFEIRF